MLSDMCHHGFLRGHCQMCVEEGHRINQERENAPRRLAAALAETKERWREEGGDYYPLTAEVAAKHGIDVWVLRDVWLQPVLASYRAADEARREESC